MRAPLGWSPGRTTRRNAMATQDRTHRRPVGGVGAGRDRLRRRRTTSPAASAEAGGAARSVDPAAPVTSPVSTGTGRRRRDPLVLLPRRRRRARAGRGRAGGRRGVQRREPRHPPHVRGRARMPAPATPSRRRSRRATARTSSGRSASAAPRRSTASGSTCSRYIDKSGYDMSPVPGVDRRPLQRRRRGPGRDPVRGLPVGPLLQGRPVQGGRSRRAAARVGRHLHHARRLGRPLGLRRGAQDRRCS